MEMIRHITIKVIIDTNKLTYEKDFDNIADAINYHDEILDMIKNN